MVGRSPWPCDEVAWTLMLTTKLRWALCEGLIGVNPGPKASCGLAPGPPMMPFPASGYLISRNGSRPSVSARNLDALENS